MTEKQRIEIEIAFRDKFSKESVGSMLSLALWAAELGFKMRDEEIKQETKIETQTKIKGESKCL